ncbi:MAG: YdeI/OmpD-associated family protein [Candidatus Nanopelagicales bacterium]
MAAIPGGSAQRPAVFFDTAADFREWLAVNHATASELWMGLLRKSSPQSGLNWEDAVLEALCFGWIDSVTQSIDEHTRRQRWTPRQRRSNWSEVNIASAEKLISEGRMRPAGMAAFERRPQAQPGYSYERASQLPPEWEAQLRADPEAERFFYQRATASYRRTCFHWVMSAKREETRAMRLANLIADSAAGQLVKPMRYGETPKWAQPAPTDE